MDLLCLVSKDEGTWSQVSNVISNHEWDNVIVLGDSESRSFQHNKSFEFIEIDFNKRLLDLRDEISMKLKNKLNGLEIACTIASGNGKEHMSLISAVINLPMGLKFVAFTKSQIIFL